MGAPYYFDENKKYYDSDLWAKTKRDAEIDSRHHLQRNRVNRLRAASVKLRFRLRPLLK
jgi:hypothetical protein